MLAPEQPKRGAGIVYPQCCRAQRGLFSPLLEEMSPRGLPCYREETTTSNKAGLLHTTVVFSL